MEFNYQDWQKQSAAECEEIARSLAAKLPAPWCFTHIETRINADNDQIHSAIFDWNGSAFALVPGGQVTLGYDSSHPFTPNAEQREEWEWTRQEYDAPAIEEYLTQVLTPLRHVELAPLLLEVEAREDESSYRKIEKALARDGFRLPSSDEWEHACAAGARTLFRWGNTCPLDCYPFDTVSCEEWNAHAPFYTAPNAFGLHIAMNPYDWEIVREPNLRRGGDGGGAICGGMGFFAGWLPLASSYCEHSKLMDGVRVRRAFELS